MRAQLIMVALKVDLSWRVVTSTGTTGGLAWQFYYVLCDFDSDRCKFQLLSWPWLGASAGF